MNDRDDGFGGFGDFAGDDNAYALEDSGGFDDFDSGSGLDASPVIKGKTKKKDFNQRMSLQDLVQLQTNFKKT